MKSLFAILSILISSPLFANPAVNSSRSPSDSQQVVLLDFSISDSENSQLLDFHRDRLFKDIAFSLIQKNYYPIVTPEMHKGKVITGTIMVRFEIETRYVDVTCKVTAAHINGDSVFEDREGSSKLRPLDRTRSKHDQFHLTFTNSGNIYSLCRDQFKGIQFL